MTNRRWNGAALIEGQITEGAGAGDDLAPISWHHLQACTWEGLPVPDRLLCESASAGRVGPVSTRQAGRGDRGAAQGRPVMIALLQACKLTPWLGSQIGPASTPGTTDRLIAAPADT